MTSNVVPRSSLRLVPVFFLLVAGACLEAGPRPAPYGARVVFRADTPIQFEDFTMSFVGERLDASPQYPRGFLMYDFRVVSASGTQTVSWSAGTGEIGPAEFTVAGRRYLLELKHSDRRGALENDELVVTPDPGTR